MTHRIIAITLPSLVLFAVSSGQTQALGQGLVGRPTLQEMYREGRVIEADSGAVDIQESGGVRVNGKLRVGIGGQADGSLTVFSGPPNGDVTLQFADYQFVNPGGVAFSATDSTGRPGQLWISPAAVQAGGYFLLQDAVSLKYISFVGEVGLLGIGGQTGITIETSLVGDSSVRFPADHLDSTTRLDETGMSIQGPEGIPDFVGTSQTAIRTATIEILAPGYVLAMGRGTLNCRNVGSVTVTLEDALGNVGQEVRLIQNDSNPCRSSMPISSQAIFPVNAAGSHSFSMLAQASSTSPFTSDIQGAGLTLTYFATAYGTVTVAASAVMNERSVAPWSAMDIVAEQESEWERHSRSVAQRRELLEHQLARHQRLLLQAVEQFEADGSREDALPADLNR